MNIQKTMLATALLAFLTGCGSSGGGSSQPTPNNEVKNDQATQAQVEKQKNEVQALKQQLAQTQKEKKSIEGYNYNKIRITIDQNLVYRDETVSLFAGNHGAPLLDNNTVIMEIKAPGNKPQWLQDILDKYGLMEHKFSKYSCAYHKSQGLPYAPRPNIERSGTAYA